MTDDLALVAAIARLRRDANDTQDFVAGLPEDAECPERNKALRAQYQELINAGRFVCDACEQQAQEITRLRAVATTHKNALERYGKHEPGCARDEAPRSCDCGFAAALAEEP